MRKAICVNSRCNKLLFKFPEDTKPNLVIKCKCGTVNEFEEGQQNNYSVRASRNVLDSYQNNIKLIKKNG